MTACRLEARMVGLALDDPVRAAHPHLDECGACADAVRGARAFESALARAAAALVTEPLPPAHRLASGHRVSAGGRGWASLSLGLRGGALASLVAVALAVIVVGVRPSTTQPVGPGSAGPSTAPVVVVPSLPVAPSGDPAASVSPTPSAPTPRVSSAGCREAFTASARLGEAEGLLPFAGDRLDKLAYARMATLLGKVLAVCTPDDLRIVNEQVPYLYVAPAPPTGKPRHVTGTFLGDVDAALAALCRDSGLRTTRSCATFLRASPAASRSP